MFALYSLALLANVNERCEEWCHEECSALNGDPGSVHSDCVGCDSKYKCNPDAASFPLAESLSPYNLPTTTDASETFLMQRPNEHIPSIYGMQMHDLETGESQSLYRYVGNVLIIVNTASGCGFADETHYNLNKLIDKYKSDGLRVLAFPSNDFDQEHRNPSELLNFFQHEQKSEFDTFQPVTVRSCAEQHPLFGLLQNVSERSIAWNYELFLVSRDAYLLAHWSSGTPLFEPQYLDIIRQALRANASDTTTRVMRAQKAVDDEAAQQATTTVEHPLCTVHRTTAYALHRMTSDELMQALKVPTLVSGLVDDWQAHRYWNSPEAFAERFETNSMRRTRFELMPDMDASVPMDEHPRAYVPEIVQKSAIWHSVIVEGASGSATYEHEFLDALSHDYSVPMLFKKTNGCHVLGIGGGVGVNMANHGFSWLGLAAGAKLWFLANSTQPRPPNPRCDRSIDALPVLKDTCRVVQLPGETMIVPTAWWHATCNLANWTIGIGAQDSCDLRTCKRYNIDSFCEPDDDNIIRKCWEPDASWERSPNLVESRRNINRLRTPIPDGARAIV